MQRLLLSILSSAVIGSAQRNAGEIRLQISDPSGSGIASAEAVLTGEATAVRRSALTDASGQFTFRALPFGLYSIRASRDGFNQAATIVDVRSELPLEVKLTLGVAPVETALVVRDSDTLLDPSRTSSVQNLGPADIAHRAASAPGRSVLELVNSQPGWLLEANGILHPRGSEYQVQYVLDGVPLFDNRSPAFAQSLGIEEFASMNIRTGGYPAEYGRKLGGVIEVTSESDRQEGWHGKVDLQRSSFDTVTGYASAQFSTSRTAVGVSAEGMRTDRYLDPPVQQNFTNRGSSAGFSLRADHDWSAADRTRAYVQSRKAHFQVPNEQLQQAAGQRQDRDAAETIGILSHTHIFSPTLLLQVREMARDTSATLWSNSLSTPILPSQDRGFRESYTSATLSGARGRHQWKTGADAIFGNVSETFGYRITAYRLNPGNVRVFDRDLPQLFAFEDRRRHREQSAFVQDLWRAGNLTVSTGVRFDRYRLAVGGSGWSPRLALAYHIPSFGLVVRGSYDRTFETPATENILLGSTNLVRSLGGEGIFLPLEPARGHFYEAGFSKTAGRHLRVDASWFKRNIRNLPDDSLLLNTGVSFPIAFARGEIHGYEVKLAVPSWGPVSAFASYSNLLGYGYTPVAGGLFLGDDAEELLAGPGRFPITQDQRNTVRSRLRWQLHSRLWTAASFRYNSGLPVELEGVTNATLLQSQYGAAILARVNSDRGRVRPSSSFDLSTGVTVWQAERRTLRVVGDVLNLVNRLNVINFSGLFSGTAIEPPRSFAVRLQADF